MSDETGKLSLKKISDYISIGMPFNRQSVNKQSETETGWIKTNLIRTYSISIEPKERLLQEHPGQNAFEWLMAYWNGNATSKNFGRRTFSNQLSDQPFSLPKKSSQTVASTATSAPQPECPPAPTSKATAGKKFDFDSPKPTAPNNSPNTQLAESDEKKFPVEESLIPKTHTMPKSDLQKPLLTPKATTSKPSCCRRILSYLFGKTFL